MKFRWSSISLETYSQLDALLRYNATDKLQQEISVLAILTGKEEKYFESISFRRLGKYQRAFREMWGCFPTEVKHEFKCKGRTFTFAKGIENFTGAHLESISLLKLNADNLAENYPKIVASLVEETSGKMFKPLSFLECAELFSKHLPCSIGIAIGNKFLSDLGEIAKIHADQPQVIEDPEILQPDFGKTPIFEHWGYFHTFFELSGRDRTKMDYWRKQTIPYIFNSLAHRRDVVEEVDSQIAASGNKIMTKVTVV